MQTNYAHQTEQVDEAQPVDDVSKVNIDEVDLIDGMLIDGTET
jgi:hypothetical protein